jgi:lysyl-tRNA synthetase class I
MLINKFKICKPIDLDSKLKEYVIQNYDDQSLSDKLKAYFKELNQNRAVMSQMGELQDNIDQLKQNINIITSYINMLTAVKRVRDEVVPKVGSFATDRDCQQAMYDIATELGLDAKSLFTALYHALINKDQGPRLANFMKIIGKEKLSKILSVY